MSEIRYEARIGEGNAAYMGRAAARLGGIDIRNEGGGLISLDAAALSQLLRQPGDADGCVSQDDDELLIWLDCYPYPVWVRS